MRIPITLAACAFAATTAFAVDYTGGDYTEDFDSMPSSGTAPTFTGAGPFDVPGLSGWTFSKYAGGGNAAFRINDGSSNGNGLYDYGTTNSSDRALGALASGSGEYQFGLTLTNTTGSTLTSFTLDFLGEQWRYGGTGNQTPLTFSYAIDATDINTGNFVSVSDLDINSIVTSGPTTGTALDGNLPENQSAISYMVDSILWNPGETITLRWTDINDGGNDDGLAVDNLTFSALAGAFTTLQWNTPGGTWDTTSPNWTGGAVYANGDIVQFLDGSQGVVNIDAGGVSPLQVQVSNTSGTYTFQGGAITGGGSLVKTGAGTLETSSEIDLAGGISIEGGTLRTLGDDLLSDTATVSIGEGATLDIGDHFETIGGLSLQGGTVAADPAALLTIAGGVSVLGSATTSVIQGVLASADSQVNFTVADGASDVDLRIDAQLYGSSRMSFSGTGTTELAGDNSGFAGGVSLEAGVLKLDSAGALGTGSFYFDHGSLISGADLTGDNRIKTFTSIGGDVTIDGTNPIEFGNVASYFGGATAVITVIGNVTFSGQDYGGKAVTGTSVINKAGSGTLTISGIDDSSGRTTVQEGTLKFSSAATFTNTGFIRVDPGATLDMSELSSKLVIQRIPGVPATDTDPAVPEIVQQLNGGGLLLAPTEGVQVDGILAPGGITAGTFTQTLTINGGPLELTSEGDFVFEIASGTDFDKLVMDGLLTLDGGDLMLSLLEDYMPDASDEFTIVSADGGIDGEFANVVDGRIEFSGGSFQIDEEGNEIVLSDFQPVPEPGAIALLAVAGAALFLIRRRAAAGR